jgi:hypothetical protein
MKMLTMEHKIKRMTACLNCSWTASLQEMKHWFTSSHQSQKETMTWKHPHSPTTKKFKIEPSVKKKPMATVF